MKSAQIENGKVVNVILGSMPDYIECDDSVGIGDLYSEGVFSKPVADINALKTAKNLQINEWRAQANLSTFPYAGKTIACDELSRSDIDAVAGSVAMNNAFPEGFPNAWKAVDNSYISLPDVASFKLMYAGMTTQGTLNFAHSQQLKATLASAQTEQEIEAIKWGV